MTLTSHRFRCGVFLLLCSFLVSPKTSKTDIVPQLCQHPTNAYCTQTCGTFQPCALFYSTRWAKTKRQFAVSEENITILLPSFANAWTNHISPALTQWTHGGVSFTSGNDVVVRYILDEDDWENSDKFAPAWSFETQTAVDGEWAVNYAELRINCFNYDADDWNINNSECEAGKWDMRAIIVHEIGHVLGMRDCQDNPTCTGNLSCTVMDHEFDQGVCYATRHTPTTTDFAGIDCAYPPIPPPIWVDTTWSHIKSLYSSNLHFNETVALSGQDNTIVWNRRGNAKNQDYWVYRSEEDSDLVQLLGTTSGWDSVFVDKSSIFGKRYKYHVASTDGTTLAEVGAPSAGLKLINDHIFDDAMGISYGDDAEIAVRGSVVYAVLGYHEVRKLSVSNPQSIVELGRRGGIGDAIAIALSEDGAKLYVQTLTGFAVLNATQNNLPVLGQVHDIVSDSGVNEGSMADMAVDGDIVFLACGTSGIKAIAVNRPGLPIVGTFDPDGAFHSEKTIWDVQMIRGRLFASERNQDGSGIRCERLSVEREYSNGVLTGVSFQIECTSNEPSCWGDLSAGTSMVGRAQDGPFELQRQLTSANPFIVINTLTEKSEAIRAVDAPAVGPMWIVENSAGVPVDTLKLFSTFASYDFDSRFLYATTPMWSDPYDRELVAFDVWADGIGLLYAGGDQLGRCLAGTVRSQGKYLYVLDDFLAVGASNHRPRLRIYEKASGCKPDPIHPVRVFPESDAYKLGQEVGISLAVGCPTSVHVELLEDGSVVSQVNTQSFAIADDVAHSIMWPIACSTSHLEDHAYSFRATATYPDNTSASFLSDPFRIEIGAKREVAIGGGKPFTSIQAAINASQSGDTVLVYAGNYVEVLTLKSNLRIVGKAGASIVVGNTTAAMTVSNVAFPPVLDGLEFHAITGTSARAVAVAGGGVVAKNCVFNSLTRAVSLDPGHAVFTSCTFTGNHSDFGGAVWLNADGTQTSFTDCQFTGNSATIRGGAVYLGSAGSYSSTAPQTTFVRCTFSGNDAPEAAAVRVGVNRRPSFDHCVFTGNHPSATSGGSVVGGAGGVSATFVNCTFASNSNSSSFDVVRLEPGGTVPIPTIDWSIFSSNTSGNAFGSYGGTYAAKNCDFYGNSSGDATWAASGTGNFSENPAYCPTGGYLIYAFSPCAPGVKSANLVGAKEVACAPNATVTVLPGGTNPPDNYLFVCPKGDGDMLSVQVALDPNVMTRTPAAEELTIQAPYAANGIYSNNTIKSAIAASSPSYVMRIDHKYLSGYTWLPLTIYLNGYPLEKKALIKRRSPDLTGGSGGTELLPRPDGKVELQDYSRWAYGYSYPGHVVPYDSLSDVNASGTVTMADFNMFCMHYGPVAGAHFQPFSLQSLQMTVPGIVTSTAHVAMEFTEEYVTAVDRQLNVDLSLENVTGATACIFAIKTNRDDLRFKEWTRANTNVLFADVTIDSTQQLYVGTVYPAAYSKAREQLGRMTFEIEGTGPMDIADDEFVLTVGDIEMLGVGNQTYGARLSGVFGRTINGPVRALFHNRLEQNFPNPFNPQTTIAFSIKERSSVHLAVYDVTGSRVKDLVNETKVPGAYKVVWNGNNNSGNQVASGVYFYKLTAKNFSSAKKMVVLK